MLREPVVVAARSAKLLALAAIFAAFSACSTSPGYEVVERVTVDQQALEEVLKTPLNFSVDRAKADQAWDRARMFFEFFIAQGNAKPEELYEARPAWISNERIPDQKYSYRIARQESSAQVSFLVKCIARPMAGGTPEKAEQNARNLARFMQYGYLEVSLLDR
jgi:hypothetical protein